MLCFLDLVGWPTPDRNDPVQLLLALLTGPARTLRSKPYSTPDSGPTLRERQRHAGRSQQGKARQEGYKQLQFDSQPILSRKQVSSSFTCFPGGSLLTFREFDEYSVSRGRESFAGLLWAYLETFLHQ